MRLLIATPLYPPDLGGPATYARLLETGLEQEGMVAPQVIKFGDVRTYPKAIRHVAFFWQVFRAAKHTDCILALDPVSVGFPALMAARLRRKKFVVKIVGDYAWEQGVQRFGVRDSLDIFVRKGRVRFPVAILRSVQTHVANSADKILVPSEYLKGIVRAWGVPQEKISVIYNAIELEQGGVIPTSVVDVQGPKIVTVGRLVPWKRIEGIIETLTELHEETTLIIVGDGPERKTLEVVASKLLPGRVIFTGPCSHADTLAIIAAADIFVLNSTYEGLSHVLIEALMLGTAVVATDAGGNNELVRNGENGILIPVQDSKEGALRNALEKLLTDTAFTEALRTHAVEARVTFSADTMHSKTAVFLKSV